MCAVGVSESQFYMWRTLFAIAHADNVVSDEEVRFMAEALEDIPFSPEQYATLKQDTFEAQNIEDMFLKVTDSQDQAVFFKYARELCHIDGDYGVEEQAVMLRLKELHVKSTDIDDLVGAVDLEFDEDAPPPQPSEKGEQPSLKKTLFSFRERFLKDRF